MGRTPKAAHVDHPGPLGACLMEGSDAALLTRSQTANHGIQSDKEHARLAEARPWRDRRLPVGDHVGIARRSSSIRQERPLFFKHPGPAAPAHTRPRQQARRPAALAVFRPGDLCAALRKGAAGEGEGDHRRLHDARHQAHRVGRRFLPRARPRGARSPFDRPTSPPMSRAVDGEMEVNENKDVTSFQL